MSREGRGRLNSIELLPEEAEPDIVWAMGALRERAMPQNKILDQFNGRLADRGIAPISSSAFNRHSMKLASIARRIESTRDIAAVLTERLEPGQTDDLTIAVAEMIKTLVFEMLQESEADAVTPKQAKEMAEAIRAAVAAQNVSTDRRRKVEADLAAKVEETVKKVGAERGLSADTIEAIKGGILGVRQ
ncbi:DUF3486 family protein [Aureimonas sp. SK2]|uniref:DUF3486 family protein n=1 Tax=Aureimonas sp. SK2 TaxID=3015992 RepID=UPI0024438099|nr:DUF3486 family protein [Aureimonas sp. SK2]